VISPLGQRQVHQTSHMEGMKQAVDATELVSREAAKKRAADDSVAEAQASVPEIPKAGAMRTEERKGRGQGGGQGAPRQGGNTAEETDAAPSEPAIPADGHLDFLA
jgi:hypothetical protein